MNPIRPLSALALGLALGSIPAVAQTPFFLDGTALGGSKVFSEGISPLGNGARFDKPQPQPAVYATFIDGDQRSRDNQTVLNDLGIGGAAVTVNSDHLRRLADSPWALRTKGYGIAYLAKTGHTSFTHEDVNSFLASTDKIPSGGTWADARRSAVDRVTLGVGSTEQGTGMGFSLRMERWKVGTQRLFLNPAGSQPALSGGPDPFAFSDMPDKAMTFAVDFGFIYELTPGIRLGGTVDRLNQKHLWDVYERPQARVGVQADIGTMSKVTLEMDVNAAQRMPFPVNQRAAAASLRIETGPGLTFIIGAERKKIGDAAVISGGATVKFRTQSYVVGLGLQIGQDKPLKGVMMMVN